MSKEIYIGAGHGGPDSGAVRFGCTESGIVTEFRDILATKLRAFGCEVATDGAGGSNLPLKNAIAIAKTVSGIRLEFHLNAGPASAAGVEILSIPALKKPAIAVAKVISSVLGSPLRGEQGWKSDSSGQHHRLGFCREGGGMVVELFFLSNKNELNTYIKKRDELANSLAILLSQL